MIEIRELVIRANVTQNAVGGGDAAPNVSSEVKNSALEQLMQGMNDKNER